MFEKLGNVLARHWMSVLALWLIGYGVARVMAPPFNQVARGGEFVFLPEDSPSRKGEALLRQAFPHDQMASNIVIVIHRDQEQALTDADHEFIDSKLKPKLQDVAQEFGAKSPNEDQAGDHAKARPAGEPIIVDVRTFSDKGVGALLESTDHQASLVMVDLTTDFQDPRNWQPVQRVEQVMHDAQSSPDCPHGLQMVLTGSATLGRDTTRAEADSARHTQWLTIALVVILLLVIYRAPLMALVPLLTLFVAVEFSLRALAAMAQAHWVPLFQGLQVYTSVITYGPGVDYCLFLIARYKENLEQGMNLKDALAHAIGRVGAAIAASGATVVCGIGMMTFAKFGKFHQAGIGISFTLAVTLLATLTLTPALLLLTGRWAFWPKTPERSTSSCASEGLGDPARESNLFCRVWVWIGHVLEERPLTVLLTTLGAMLPFVIVAVITYREVSFGLFEELPKNAPSAEGAKILAQHFPAGITGPIGIVLRNDRVDFRESSAVDSLRNLSQNLIRHEELHIVDIRSAAAPLGLSQADVAPAESAGLRLLARGVVHRKGVEHYVSSEGDLAGHVARLEAILNVNPFSLNAIDHLDLLKGLASNSLPQEISQGTDIFFVGPTSSVHDLNKVSRSDQNLINVLVVGSVLVILVILLRSFSISLYLIMTVLLSYLAALGVTHLTFHALDPRGFVGLDWTVPLFLFVVLIAVGADYNIFLVTRVHEEQRQHGPVRGITIALVRTGGIITSCGFIMAGTFSSLTAGSLARMQQLGFALAFGVMLDTFVVRPLLVPAFLVILHSKRYGELAKYAK